MKLKDKLPIIAQAVQKYALSLGWKLEEARIAIHNLRREAMEELKGLEKNKGISQDELKRALEQLQKLTDSFIAEAEGIGRDKEAEIAEA